MSEIKGQLLGIIIVLMVFAAVGGAMTVVFQNFANTVAEQSTTAIEEGVGYTSYDDSQAGAQSGDGN